MWLFERASVTCSTCALSNARHSTSTYSTDYISLLLVRTITGPFLKLRHTSSEYKLDLGCATMGSQSAEDFLTKQIFIEGNIVGFALFSGLETCCLMQKSRLHIALSVANFLST